MDITENKGKREKVCQTEIKRMISTRVQKGAKIIVKSSCMCMWKKEKGRHQASREEGDE